MININFFEKKEINILPYLITGVFLLALVLMSLYFYFARTYLSDVTTDQEIWINEHAEEVLLAEKMSQLDQQYNETIELKEKLEADQYPMYQVAVEIAATVPNELVQISSFQLANGGQLTLTLENTDAIMAQEIVEQIEYLPYITELQLLYAETQGQDGTQLRFDLIISLDEELLMQEESE